MMIDISFNPQKLRSHISTRYIESTLSQYCRVKYGTDFLWYSSTIYILCVSFISIVQIFLLMHFFTAMVWNDAFLQLLW